MLFIRDGVAAFADLIQFADELGFGGDAPAGARRESVSFDELRYFLRREVSQQDFADRRRVRRELGSGVHIGARELAVGDSTQDHEPALVEDADNALQSS